MSTISSTPSSIPSRYNKHWLFPSCRRTRPEIMHTLLHIVAFYKKFHLGCESFKPLVTHYSISLYIFFLLFNQPGSRNTPKTQKVTEIRDLFTKAICAKSPLDYPLSPRQAGLLSSSILLWLLLAWYFNTFQEEDFVLVLHWQLVRGQVMRARWNHLVS